MSSMDAAAGQEAAVLDDLASVGYRFASLADLRHSRRRYRSAVPVLLEWLPRISDQLVKEEIVRALSVPWAKPAATRPMIEVFSRLDAAADPAGMGLR